MCVGTQGADNTVTGSPLAGKLFVVIGAGGAGKALAYGAKEQGARVVIANRTYGRISSCFYERICMKLIDHLMFNECACVVLFLCLLSFLKKNIYFFNFFLFFVVLDRAKALADLVGGDAISLSDLDSYHPEDGMVLANTTSIGMHPNVSNTPISKVYHLSYWFNYTMLNGIAPKKLLIVQIHLIHTLYLLVIH